MLSPPMLPSGVLSGEHRKHGARERSRNGSLQHLRPQASGFAVIHQKIRFVYFSGNPEGQSVATVFRVINNARQAEWTPGNNDRFSVEVVIHYFVPVQNSDGVGFS